MRRSVSREKSEWKSFPSCRAWCRCRDISITSPLPSFSWSNCCTHNLPSSHFSWELYCVFAVACVNVKKRPCLLPSLVAPLRLLRKKISDCRLERVKRERSRKKRHQDRLYYSQSVTKMKARWGAIVEQRRRRYMTLWTTQNTTPRSTTTTCRIAPAWAAAATGREESSRSENE